MDEQIKRLESFGLTNNEAKTYLSCLNLGTSTAYQISNNSGVSRTLTYDILQKLINKCLISKIIEDKKIYYTAIDPKELINILDNKKNNIMLFVKDYNSNVKKEDISKQVRVYNDLEGIKYVFNQILELKPFEILSLSGNKSSFEIDPIFFAKWNKNRIQLKIKGRMLYNKTKNVITALKEKKEFMKLTKHKFFEDNFILPTTIIIYDDFVITISWQKNNLFAIQTKNKDFANAHRQYFEQLWKSLK